MSESGGSNDAAVGGDDEDEEESFITLDGAKGGIVFWNDDDADGAGEYPELCRIVENPLLLLLSKSS